DHQILGRLVEHPAPGRVGVSSWRLHHRSDDLDPALADGRGVHPSVCHAVACGHAQRDFAAPGADHAATPGERGRVRMQATAHIEFIVAAYAAGVVVIAALIAWVMLDYRLQRRILAELETKGIARRSAREAVERADT